MTSRATFQRLLEWETARAYRHLPWRYIQATARIIHRLPRLPAPTHHHASKAPHAQPASKIGSQVATRETASTTKAKVGFREGGTQNCTQPGNLSGPSVISFFSVIISLSIVRPDQNVRSPTPSSAGIHPPPALHVDTPPAGHTMRNASFCVL
jgi:hypothetical protein